MTHASGGLLIAEAPDALDAVMAKADARGFDRTAVIGIFTEGDGRVTVA